MDITNWTKGMTTKTPDHHLLIIFLTGDEQLVIHYDFVFFPCFFFAKTTISLALSIGCVYETMMQPEHNFLLLKNWKNITKLFLSWNTLRVKSSYFMQKTFLKVEANNYSRRWGYHVVYDK